jgi:hypothetical protein
VLEDKQLIGREPSTLRKDEVSPNVPVLDKVCGEAFCLGPTGGYASPVDKTLGRVGRPFVQLVLEALVANRITSVDASRYLDCGFDHIRNLRRELFSKALERDLMAETMATE